MSDLTIYAKALIATVARALHDDEGCLIDAFDSRQVSETTTWLPDLARQEITHATLYFYRRTPVRYEMAGTTWHRVGVRRTTII
jgi:hypothetical protein